MLLKHCTQYTSKFGKLSSGHRPGKGEFLFQCQRKAMPKNVQITILLHSFHMLARFCSKSFNPDFSSKWTKNFQMYKLDLEKAEEPEINLPISTGSYKKQGNSGKSSTFLHWLHKSLCVDHNKLLKILKEMEIPDHIYCLLRNVYAGQDATVRTGHWTMDWLKIGKRIRHGCILSPCLFTLYAEYIMQNARLDEAQVGIKTA